ncbi:MAG: AraC family transcriptional regulator [Alistipes sp.]
MDHSIHLKYLAINPTDQLWGMTVNSVGHQSIEANAPYPPNNHPARYIFSTDNGRILNEYQLLYITKGSGRFYSQTTGCEQAIPVKSGDMFLLFPGEWHNYMPDKGCGWDEFWIGFQGTHIDYWTKNSFFTQEKPLYNVGLNPEIVQLYRQAIQVALEQKSGFQQVLSGIVNLLLGLAYFYDKNHLFETSETVTQINRAKIMIADRFKEISPKQIAEELNMSYSNFRKIFKEYTGFAPAQYIQEMKLSKAKELLTHTTVPVKEIAYLMGFENQEYFFTAFKKKNRVTPAEYRRMTQGRIKQNA